MKKFVIIMLGIIVISGCILGIKIMKGNNQSSSNDKGYSRIDISNLLEEGKKYKNYSCEYIKSEQHTVRKIKDNKMVVIGDNIANYIDYNTNKQTVVRSTQNVAIISSLDSNRLIAIDKLYFQEVIDAINDTSKYNYQYIEQEKINNFDCAKIELKSTTITYNIWIDISSGLVTKLYYKNTETNDDITTEFNLKLDCVTDKEVTVPDLSNYRIEEI